MSDAVVTTGILVKRRALTPPAGVAITSSSVAAATVITLSAPHGLKTGDSTTIAGHTGATPALNGVHVVTKIGANSFSIPVTVTVAGADGTSTPDLIVVAEITNVDPGGKMRNKLPTTTHNEGTESHQLGILRQEDPTFKVNFVGTDASHVAINDDIDNNVLNNWQIAFPSGITRTGNARVQKLKFDAAPVDGVQGAEMGLAWSGPVTEVLA